MKTHINQFLRSQGITGQTQIRRASWRHCELYKTDETYCIEAQELYSDIGTIPCASSSQDVQHQTHLVNAIILTLIHPQEGYNLTKQQPYPCPQPVATQAEDQDECTMYKSLLYKHLWKVIQNYGKTKGKSTNWRLQEVEERLTKLEQYTGINADGEDTI